MGYGKSSILGALRTQSRKCSCFPPGWETRTAGKSAAKLGSEPR